MRASLALRHDIPSEDTRRVPTSRSDPKVGSSVLHKLFDHEMGADRMGSGWAGTTSALSRVVIDQTQACLRVYHEDSSRIEEDAAIELNYAEGGYRTSQLQELMQNATDALRQAPGRIQAVLTNQALYVANAGDPFSEDGVKTLMASHVSRKSEEEIGQYGLGFKSVLAVSDEPAVFSRTGSFQFSKQDAERAIRAKGLQAGKYPTLRTAVPIDPEEQALKDTVLAELMTWSSTIVRLPLKRGREQLSKDFEAFRPEFMLFAPQVTEVILDDRSASTMRTMRLEREGPHFRLLDNHDESKWFVAKRRHRPSAEALRDAGQLMRRESVEVSWAAPLKGRRRTTLGEFWAHFPTGLYTTLGGIVNAPWKLSGDRLSMLDGKYNRELLKDVLPPLIAGSLAALHGPEDPAAILDLLPARGLESRSFGDRIINTPVMEAVASRPCLPDFTGTLRPAAHLSLAPSQLPASWVGLWNPPRPVEWVHPAVDSTRERRAKAERLIQLGEGSSVTLTS